jgi:hypothetical protein
MIFPFPIYFPLIFLIFMDLQMISCCFPRNSCFFRAFQVDFSPSPRFSAAALYVHYDAGIDEPAEAMMRPEARSQSHDCGSMVSESPTMAVDAEGKTMPFDAPFDASHAPSPQWIF